MNPAPSSASYLSKAFAGSGRRCGVNIKVAVLGTRGFPEVQGGVESHCENLYPELVKCGCEVTVFTRKPYTAQATREHNGVKLLPLWCPRNRFLEAFIHTLLGVFAAKRIAPDILHIHAIGPSLFIPLARIMGMKVVMTNHGPDYRRKKWGGLARFVLRMGETSGSTFANEIICISKDIGDGIRKRFGRDVHVIPNGVKIQPPLATDGIIKRYGLVKNRYILAVGRFVPEKGFHYLFDAFESIGDGRIDAEKWKLVVAGEADHKSAYSISLEKRAGDNPNIVLTGFLSGQPLQELYSHAGLFVLPSYYEGMPIVLLEAMGYGLSCIASDIPANRALDLADDRYFSVGDAGALRTKILEFAHPLSKNEKTGQIGMIAAKYNWENAAQETLKVYTKAIT